MGKRLLRLNHRALRKLRLLLYIMLILPVGVLTFGQIKQQWGSRDVRQKDVQVVMECVRQGKSVPTKYQGIWKKLRPAQIAFERIALDLQTRLNVNRRYFDRAYIEGMIVRLEENIAKNPRGVFYLLGYYALNGETPLKKALALIAIRERYPKKYCVYYANRLINSSDPMLASLSRDIVSNRYQVSSLKKKFTPKYLRSLQKTKGKI